MKEKDLMHDTAAFIEHSKESADHVKSAAKKLFSPLSRAFENVDTDFADRSRVKKTLISIYILKTPLCILMAFVMAASALYSLLKSQNTATTEMSLNYEESANGLNPNSTRLNVYDIVSQEVVEKALSYCGIDPDSVDVNDVIDCITVRPTNTKSFSEDDPYISTSYKITMKKPKGIKGVSVGDLLSFLCKAYKDNLYSKYTENRSILDFDIDQFDDTEFMEIADLLDLKAQQIEKYLNMRVKQSKTFTEAKSDETFKSLMKKIENLRDYDIAKYRAFVIESGCSEDKNRYVKSLSYVNLINDISYNKDMAAYDVHNDGIKMYDEAMISIVMIPSIDTSKNTYYMSKTKTGMDYMASQANSYLLTAQETAKKMAINSDLIEKIGAGINKSEDIKKAQDMISDIRLKFSEISKNIETVDKAYIKHKTKDYLTFKTASLSITQKFGVSTLVVIAAVMALGIYTAIWLRFRFVGGGKKE